MTIAVGSALGQPIGSHFDLTAAPFRQELQLTLAAVDAIHGDGTLPTVSVAKIRGGATAGTFSPPDEVRIATSTREPHLTLLHELGHLLDWRGGAYLSDLEASELAEWRAAVEGTPPVLQLRAMTSRRTQLVKYFSWRGPERVTIKQHWVRELLRPTEMFARSYSQFIAERAGIAQILAELDKMRSRPIELLYPEQWQEVDFKPVAAAFEVLFRRRGWMQ